MPSPTGCQEFGIIMIRILFVCMGNICRSPAAEGVFKALVDERGLTDSFFVDSAGTIDFHAGNPADARMRRAAAQRNLDLSSIARGIERDDFARSDWVVTMDDENFRNVKRIAPSVESAEKVRKFVDWVTISGVEEVPDPYYGGRDGFEKVLDILENGCANLLDWLVRRYGLNQNVS